MFAYWFSLCFFALDNALLRFYVIHWRICTGNRSCFDAVMEGWGNSGCVGHLSDNVFAISFVLILQCLWQLFWWYVWLGFHSNSHLFPHISPPTQRPWLRHSSMLSLMICCVMCRISDVARVSMSSQCHQCHLKVITVIWMSTMSRECQYHHH